MARQIDYKEISNENQKYDVSMTYQPCTKTWSAHSKNFATVYSDDDIYHMVVKDISTCELLHPKEGTQPQTLEEMIAHVNNKD